MEANHHNESELCHPKAAVSTCLSRSFGCASNGCTLHPITCLPIGLLKTPSHFPDCPLGSNENHQPITKLAPCTSGEPLTTSASSHEYGKPPINRCLAHGR